MPKAFFGMLSLLSELQTGQETRGGSLAECKGIPQERQLLRWGTELMELTSTFKVRSAAEMAAFQDPELCYRSFAVSLVSAAKAFITVWLFVDVREE